MKNALLILFLILSCAKTYCQVSQFNEALSSSKESINPLTGDYTTFNEDSKSEIQFNLEDFNFDCSTDFFTINIDGDIRQWNFNGNFISGGDLILQGGGISLAFCGDSEFPSFYSGKNPSTGIIYYDSFEGWVDIPAEAAVTNNGGYKEDQYFLEAVYDSTAGISRNRVLYHFDGEILSTLDYLSPNNFGVADVAVDTLGQAWTFVEDSIFHSNKIYVYNNEGMVTSYDTSFDTQGAYGSFFLNDTLYVARGNFIRPVYINGSIAEFGTGIFFPNNNFYDIASCQNGTFVTSSLAETSKSNFKVFPNPTNNILYLPQNVIHSKVEVFDSKSQLTRTFKKVNSIELTDLPSGIYFVKVTKDEGVFTSKIMKN